LVLEEIMNRRVSADRSQQTLRIGSDEERNAGVNRGQSMTEGEYWGTLKAWGFTGKRRVTPRTFTMLDRDSDACNIPDPATKTPAEREADIALIRKLHVRLDS
jgi:hypothetical protein